MNSFFPLTSAADVRLVLKFFFYSLEFRGTNVNPKYSILITRVLDELAHIHVCLMTSGVETRLWVDFPPTILVSQVEDIQERWAPRSHSRSEPSTGCPSDASEHQSGSLMGSYSRSSPTIRTTW